MEVYTQHLSMADSLSKRGSLSGSDDTGVESTGALDDLSDSLSELSDARTEDSELSDARTEDSELSDARTEDSGLSIEDLPHHTINSWRDHALTGYSSDEGTITESETSALCASCSSDEKFTETGNDEVWHRPRCDTGGILRRRAVKQARSVENTRITGCASIDGQPVCSDENALTMPEHDDKVNRKILTLTIADLLEDLENDREEIDSSSVDAGYDTSSVDAGYGSKDSEELELDKVKLRRRASSLKSIRTPPGTPGQRKYVRFADTLGLELTKVRLLAECDSPPFIPQSAFSDLHWPPHAASTPRAGQLYLSPWFPHRSNHDVVSLVQNNQVHLENTSVIGLHVSGQVRVANINYHKQVFIRYTTDAWRSCLDVRASYVPNSNVCNTDAFSFSIQAPNNFSLGSRLEFAVCYRTNGKEFWDSNNGHNYVFECYHKLDNCLSLDFPGCFY